MIPKFRAWGKSNSEMLKVDCINWYMDEIVIYPDNELAFSMKLENIELMQYTGLKDKNGVEIFEGDIVHWKDCESIDDEIVYENTFVIYWSDEFLIWRAKNKGNDIDLYDISDNRELEIIGNIYENKELIEVECN